MVKVQKNKCNQITGTLSRIEQGITYRKTISRFSHDITLVLSETKIFSLLSLFARV